MKVSREKLIAGLDRLGVIGEPEAINKLLAFSDLIVHWNKGMNLISRRDIGRLLSRHILDSLSVLPHLNGNSVLDVGTGAGLPGIPLAVLDENRSYMLCDRMAKRIRFLRMAVRELQLKNVILEERNLAKQPFERPAFDTILARGVASATELWPMVEPYLNKNGKVIVFESAQIDVQAKDEDVSPVNPAASGKEHAFTSEQIRCDILGLEYPHFLRVLHH